MLLRFEREAQATAALSSPHTIRVFDFGITGDRTFYYVMELLTGRDLDSLVREFGPVPADRALYLLRQVCHSLADAHARGLIERVSVDEIRLPLRRGDVPPRRAAEQLFVHVQRGHRQPAEAAPVLKAIHEVACVWRAEDDRCSSFDWITRLAEERRPGDDVHLDAERAQLVRPGEMPRLTTAAHHRQTTHQHRHAHCSTRQPWPVVARSTWVRAHSSRQTSAQIRLA